MKKFITLLIILSVSGCAEHIKVETPPWNEKQITQLQKEEIEVVPIVVIRF